MLWGKNVVENFYSLMSKKGVRALSSLNYSCGLSRAPRSCELRVAPVANWHNRQPGIIRAKDLWGLIDGSDLPPEDDASDDVKHRYKRDCNRAIAMITTNISDSKIYLVTSCEDTPRGIWDTLKEHFEGKTGSRKLSLMKAFFGLKMHEGTTVMDPIRALKDLIDKLRAVDM